MATHLMPEKSKQTQKSLRKQFRRGSESAEPSVRQIIAAGRSVPNLAAARGSWLVSGITVVLLWASFMPLDWGPLGWIALVPLILLVRLERQTRWMYTAVYSTALVCTLATLQWMRLGDRAMYLAWFALAIYVAMYFPIFVALSRVAVHRFAVPLTITVPTVWVGLEFLRGHLMTGFGWYFLGHTQYRWIELIQISDLLGAYGVSFVMVTLAACLAGLVPASVFARFRLLPAGSEPPATNGTKRQAVSVVFGLTLFAAILSYGYIRRAQADFQEGPRIALIETNFTASLKHDPGQANLIYQQHHKLTGQAVRHLPDLIVWPETMYRDRLMIASPDMSPEELKRAAPLVPPDYWRESAVPQRLANDSKMAGAAMIVGLEAVVADTDGFRHYNSAAFVRPDMGLSGRYDKLHRVPFGEYIPLKNELSWLHKLTPFPTDWGLTAGESAAVFNVGKWRFAPIICFEDTVPHLVRRIVSSTVEKQNHNKPVDCLVNLTNDGWFHGSSELDQHLITAAFRAVECRTPMVRAVNTGVSAFIDGDGVILEPDVFIDGDHTGDGKGRDSMRDPKTGRWHRQLNAALVDTIPLDNRASLYVAWGDWFAGTCGFCCIALILSGLVPRRRSGKNEQETTE